MTVARPGVCWSLGGLNERPKKGGRRAAREPVKVLCEAQPGG